MKSARCPTDFEPNEKSLQFCYKFGMSKNTIADYVEEMKDHTFKQLKSDWDATFRNWIRTAVRYGHITPVQEHVYNMPKEESTEEKKRAMLQYAEQIKRFGK
jgi:hypothetical protein